MASFDMPCDDIIIAFIILPVQCELPEIELILKVNQKFLWHAL